MGSRGENRSAEMEKVVAVICALGTEARSVSNLLSLESDFVIRGRRITKGLFESALVYVIKSGIGKVQAAAATQMAIDCFDPGLVINFGTAGSVDPSVAIGDVIFSTKAVAYDVRGSIGVKKEFSADGDLLKLARSVEGAKIGVILSADRNAGSSDLRTELFKRYNAQCADWEGAAVLQVCELNSKRGIVVRAVSDATGKYFPLEFLLYHRKVLAKGAQILEEFLKKIVRSDLLDGDKEI